MAPSSKPDSFGNLFGGKPAKSSQALSLRDFSIVQTSSALRPVGETAVEMVTPEWRVITVPAWLSFMYSELQTEFENLGNVIVEIQRQEQNPRYLGPDICAAYELALHYQRQLYKSDLAKLRDAHYEDYLRFEATSKQFTGEVQIGMQYLALTLVQRTQEVGNELLNRINMAAAVNSAQR